jgi:hypothetical protein
MYFIFYKTLEQITPLKICTALIVYLSLLFRELIGKLSTMFTEISCFINPSVDAARGAIHQLLNIILQLRILVLLLVSTLPYVVKVKNYS